MKINNINLCSYNNYISGNNNRFKTALKTEQPDCNSGLNPMEMLGRSQVKFTGGLNDYDFDKNYFDNISKILDLSKVDKDRFKKIVKRYLKDSGFSSVEDFCNSVDFKDDEHIDNFLGSVASGLNLSDEEIDVLGKDLLDSMLVRKVSNMCNEDEDFADIIFPIVVANVKNNLVCNNLIDKYDLAPKEAYNIMEYIKKMDQDVSPEQVAFQITENYNLFSIEDYHYVLETIQSRDKLFEDFLLVHYNDIF